MRIHKLVFRRNSFFNSIYTYDRLLVLLSLRMEVILLAKHFFVEKAYGYSVGLKTYVYIRIIREYVRISWRWNEGEAVRQTCCSQIAEVVDDNFRWTALYVRVACKVWRNQMWIHSDTTFPEFRFFRSGLA